MIENLLSGILGTSGKSGDEKEESGLGSLLPLIILFVIIIGGLKLLAPKEQEEKLAD